MSLLFMPCVGVATLGLGVDLLQYRLLKGISLPRDSPVDSPVFHVCVWWSVVPLSLSLPLSLAVVPARQVSTAALVAGYGAGLGLVCANRYLRFSDEPLAYATIGFTGFFYAVFSMYIYVGFRYVLRM